MARDLKIYFDGGCRPNPGAMEIAVVISGRTHLDRALGHGTSMDAEWLALIHALRMAMAIGATNFVLIGDCAAVVGQARGVVRCRGTNIVHRDRFYALIGASPLPRIRQIKRSQNLAGIALAKLHAR